MRQSSSHQELFHMKRLSHPVPADAVALVPAFLLAVAPSTSLMALKVSVVPEGMRAGIPAGRRHEAWISMVRHMPGIISRQLQGDPASLPIHGSTTRLSIRACFSGDPLAVFTPLVPSGPTNEVFRSSRAVSKQRGYLHTSWGKK